MNRTAVIVTTLLLLGLSATSAVPAAAGVFFSEYVEGSSNNKAVELYNPTGAGIDLAAGSYKIEIYFNGSATPASTINLTGTIASGGTYVVANTSAAAAILAVTNQTSGSLTFNGDDAVVLKQGSTTLDVIGQIGFDPGSEWGTGLVSTADNTVRRKSTVCQGDTDGSNVFDPSIEWNGYATDTFDGLGAHTASCGTIGVEATTWENVKNTYR